MDIAHNRSLGFAGKEILFRKIEFERYRKPHVVEYPRSAIVLNPQHTRQLKDELHHHRHHAAAAGEEEDAEGSSAHNSDGEDSGSDDDDDPRRMDKTTQLCSDAQLRSCLHLRWQRIAPVGLGLMNLGNTCFANSVLQAFAHTPALAQYFMSTFRSADNQLGAPFDFAFALAETFRQMHHTSPSGRSGGAGSGAYRPGQIMGNLRLLSKHFSIGRQSDAHEFAVQLLFSCQKSLLHRLIGSKKVQPRVAHTTALYRICGGYLLSQVTWSRQDEIQQLLRAGKQQEAMDLKMEAKQAQQRLQAEEEERRHNPGHKTSMRRGQDIQTLYSNTYDPFTILSVELAGHTLQHCLDKFCLAEELDGRCYHSPREVGVRAKKKFTIHVPPPVLMVHLKRFGPTGNKINKHVQFPLELDLTPYCTPLPTSSSSSSSPAAASSSSPALRESGGKREDCQYELSAICVHEGRCLNYGHYYTMAKASNGMWYEFNDSHVSRLSEDQLHRAQAYMLFYSCVPASTAPNHRSAGGPVSGTRAGAASLGEKDRGRLPRPAEERWAALSPAVPPQDDVASAGVGKELSEADVQALLEKRRKQAQQSNGSHATIANDAPAASAKTGFTTAERAQTFKRGRESLPTDSDSDGDAEEEQQRTGAYLRPMRQAPSGQRRAERIADSDDENGNNSTRPSPSDADRAEEDEEQNTPSPASDTAPAATPKSHLFGGLIKSMKRYVHGSNEAPANASTTSANGSNARDLMTQRPPLRVGRHAVSALHNRKALNTPDSVKRPMAAPKFQQRIRDPMWEMEMDRGKVKKVKSKEKAPDLFEGTNPFQEVSRGMFDIRGRRRRD